MAGRLAAQRLFDGLQAEGYRGAYDSVQRFVKQWKSAQTRPTIKEAFVPLVFAPGDACQFDWSQERVEIGGVTLPVKGSYQSIRKYVAAVRVEFPDIAVDDLSLRRENIGSSEVDAQLRFVLFGRKKTS